MSSHSADQYQRPTIAAIARAAGTSRATASKVLSGHPEGERISAPVQARIRACAEHMGWRPLTPLARLARRPTIGYAFAYPLPYGVSLYGSFPTILAEAAAQDGYDLRVILVDEDLGGWDTLSRRDDPVALICLESLVPYLPQLLPRLQVPTVLVNWPCDLALDQVITDDAGGMAQAAQHLFELGHRHVLYFEFSTTGHPSSKTARRTSLHTHFQDLSGRCETLIGTTEQVISTLRSHPAITAIVTYGGAEALAVHGPLQVAGFDIPGRISLLCGSTHGALDQVQPRISYVHTNNWDMATAAVKLVLARVRGELPVPPQTVVVPQCLRLTDSVARACSVNELVS